MEALETITGSKPTAVKSLYDTSNLKQWMFERVSHYIRGKVLEVAKEGDTTGSICAFQGIDSDIYSLSLVDGRLEETHPELMQSYQTLVTIDIMSLAIPGSMFIANSAKTLTYGGYLIICMPAPIALYNGLNAGVPTWDNRNKQYLRQLFGHYFRLVKTRYFELAVGNPDNTSLESPVATTYYKVVSSFILPEVSQSSSAGLYMVAVARRRGH